MTTMDDDEEILSKYPGDTISGTVSAHITQEFIMDLYDQCRDMEDGELKDSFRTTLKVLEQHIGSYLTVPDMTALLDEKE